MACRKMNEYVAYASNTESGCNRLCLVSFITERQIFNFWTLNILQKKFIISDKDPFNFKGTTPIYKQDIWKNDF